MRKRFGTAHENDIRKAAVQKSIEVSANNPVRTVIQSLHAVIYARTQLYLYLFSHFTIQLGMPTFKASSYWIHTWKKKHKIVSRKIIKVLSRKEIADLPKVSDRVNDYRAKIRSDASNYQSCDVWNTDQSGFNIELLYGRTLEHKGEKQVLGSINQSNSQSHSYTIQPMISMDGIFAEKLLIVWQEREGEFGPNVREHLFTHPEIFVQATKSGKVTKNILQTWFEELYFPLTRDKTLLVLDSYSAYKDLANINQVKPRGKSLKISTIPPGLTGYCQPLDVAVFRPYKSIARAISQHIHLYRPDIKLHSRNAALKLQACMNFLMRAPRFQCFIRYAWYKAGLCETFDRSTPFEDPSHYCFPKDIYSFCCSSPNCREPCFLRCSWCAEKLCFEHFFVSARFTGDTEFLKFHYCLKFTD